MAQELRAGGAIRQRIQDSRLGRWVSLYIASAYVWYWSAQDLVAEATSGIGSKSSPISGTGASGSSTGGGIKDNKTFSGDAATAKTKESLNSFATFMWYIMGFTFVIALLCGLAAGFVGTAKLSMAIQEGNASATQKHIKDNVQFYINTAIAAGSLFILELVAYFVGMYWVFGGSGG